MEIVKHGKDPNITFGAGTVVRVACGKGYGLNLEVNTTAKCVKGRWKPAKPVCSISKYFYASKNAKGSNICKIF